MIEQLRFIFGIFAIIAVVTVVLRVASFILCIFSTIQTRHLNELTTDEIKASKRRTVTGLILDILVLMILIVVLSVILILNSMAGGQAGAESPVSLVIVWIVLSVIEIVIQFVNVRKIKNFKVTNEQKIEQIGGINQNDQTPVYHVDAEQKKIKEKQRSFDLYALIISLLTLPIEAIIGLASHEEDIKWVNRSNSLAGLEKVRYIPSEAKMLMIILLIASIAVSLFLILRNGKNHSNKATWVKMLTVLNIIGGIVILALP